MNRFLDWLLPQTPWDASRYPRNIAAGAAVGLLIGIGIGLRIG
jgi:hypothetical protein